MRLCSCARVRWYSRLTKCGFALVLKSESTQNGRNFNDHFLSVYICIYLYILLISRFVHTSQYTRLPFRLRFSRTSIAHNDENVCVFFSFVGMHKTTANRTLAHIHSNAFDKFKLNFCNIFRPICFTTVSLRFLMVLCWIRKFKKNAPNQRMRALDNQWKCPRSKCDGQIDKCVVGVWWMASNFFPSLKSTTSSEYGINKLLTVQLIHTHIVSAQFCVFLYRLDSCMELTRHIRSRSLAPENDGRDTWKVYNTNLQRIERVGRNRRFVCAACRSETMQCKPDRKEHIKCTAYVLLGLIDIRIARISRSLLSWLCVCGCWWHTFRCSRVFDAAIVESWAKKNWIINDERE